MLTGPIIYKRVVRRMLAVSGLLPRRLAMGVGLTAFLYSAGYTDVLFPAIAFMFAMAMWTFAWLVVLAIVAQAARANAMIPAATLAGGVRGWSWVARSRVRAAAVDVRSVKTGLRQLVR